MSKCASLLLPKFQAQVSTLVNNGYETGHPSALYVGKRAPTATQAPNLATLPHFTAGEDFGSGNELYIGDGKVAPKNEVFHRFEANGKDTWEDAGRLTPSLASEWAEIRE